MRPFVFQRAGGQWPEGATLLHLYVQADLSRNPELAALVRDARQALEGFPLSHVDDPWLHITVDQITDQIAADIPQDERDLLVRELSKRLREVEPFDLMVGSVLSSRFGVIADLHPDGPLVGLHDAVRDTVREVRGDEAVLYPWGVQHLTVSYAVQEADSDEAQRLLRRVRPGHAPLHVDTVHLVDVTADSQAKTITWQHLAEIPLGNPDA
ncbi:2'-5' RNA ligase family protein [Streptomyces decoyicus]|uniref:2'-5' RNA ligase family protein n=1 Tax=Streptomyces decoyicus TaxID=249567 RepID=UPI00386970E7